MHGLLTKILIKRLFYLANALHRDSQLFLLLRYRPIANISVSLRLNRDFD